MKIKHVFFDLDRTLWDFEANSQKALEQLYHELEIDKRTEHFLQFIVNYKRINASLWKDYGKGKITKDYLRDARFQLTLEHLNIFDDELAKKLSDGYVALSPRQTLIFPHAIEVLEELKKMGVKLHIITNGFKEVQFIKLENCGLLPFFEVIVCSEDVGFNKPDKQIFQYAMDKAGAKADESMMIGDDLEVDVEGALRIGMHAIHFDPNKEFKSQKGIVKIQDLQEIPYLVASTI